MHPAFPGAFSFASKSRDLRNSRSSFMRASSNSFTVVLIRSSASFAISSRGLFAIGGSLSFGSFLGRLPCCPLDTVAKDYQFKKLAQALTKAYATSLGILRKKGAERN